MKAMVLKEPCEIMTAEGSRKKTALPLKKNPLELEDMPEPHPGPGDLLVKVSTCGVCHTELDEIEGRLIPCPNWIILSTSGMRRN